MVVLESQKAEIQKTLQEICDTKLQLDFVEIKDDGDIGTADSLRLIADKITVSYIAICTILSILSINVSQVVFM